MKIGDKVESINGESGLIEAFGGPQSAPWAMVRNKDGFVQSFGLHVLRQAAPVDAYGLPIDQ